ncbi:hypothetical protein D3C86_1412240 [compost metagenome]
MPRAQRRIAKLDGGLGAVIVHQGAHGNGRDALVRQLVRIQRRRDTRRVGRIAVARKGQHPEVRFAGVGVRDVQRGAGDVGGLGDTAGLHAQLDSCRMHGRRFRRQRAGGIGLGDGAFPLLGAPQQAGQRAAFVGALGVGGNQHLKRGDGKRKPAFPHVRRHQQAAHIAPSIAETRQRRRELGHVARGVVGGQDFLDDFAQPRGGVGLRATCRDSRIDSRSPSGINRILNRVFNRVFNHAATPSTTPSPRG